MELCCLVALPYNHAPLLMEWENRNIRSELVGIGVSISSVLNVCEMLLFRVFLKGRKRRRECVAAQKRFLDKLNNRVTVLLVALLLAGFGGLGWYTVEAVTSYAEASRREATETLVGSVHNTTEVYLSNLQKLCVGLARQRAVVAALRTGADEGETAQRRFKDYVATYPEIWSAYAFDIKGKAIAGFNAANKDERGDNKAKHRVVADVLAGSAMAMSRELTVVEGGRLALRMAVPVRDPDTGQLVGGVQVSFNFHEFEREVLTSVRNGETGYLYLLDEKGTYLAHPDTSKVMTSGVHQPHIARMVKEYSGFMRYVLNGEPKFAAFQPIEQTGWVLVANISEAEVFAAANKLGRVVVGISILVSVLLAAVIVMVLRRLVIQPLASLQQYAGEIAAGDFGTKAQGRFSCEFADLADDIDHMKEKIKVELGFAQGVLRGIPTPCGIVAPDFTMKWANDHLLKLLERPGKPQDYLGMLSGDFYLRDPQRETLSDKAIKTGTAQQGRIEWQAPSGRVYHISVATTPFYDMDGVLLGSISFWNDISDIVEKQREVEAQHERIAEAARQAMDVAARLSAASEELSAQIEESSRGTETQRTRISETAAAVEQMNASILEVARNAGDAVTSADTARDSAGQGAAVVHDAVGSIDMLRGRMRDMGASLEELGRQADGIGAIIDMISDIADQTNLLALNAAIEAARAGDAGRGFAVVADEVRKLAEKTMGATNDVGNAIRAIQGVTRKTVDLMGHAASDADASVARAGDAGSSLQSIVGLSVGTADQVRSIATAAEQQSAASEEIARATEEISVIASETAEAMHQSAAAIAEVADMAGELERIIEGMKS